MREKIKTTDGNLSVQLRKLEDPSFIKTKKEYVNRKPVSTYLITEKGKDGFNEYVKKIESLLNLEE